MSKLLDTTVLVDVIRKEEAALDYIDSTRKAEGSLRLSIVTKMELIIGCRDKAEVQKTEKLLADYEVLDVTPLISRKAYELTVRFSKAMAWLSLMLSSRPPPWWRMRFLSPPTSGTSP
jgi:predicted nucleic acid-binding protein